MASLKELTIPAIVEDKSVGLDGVHYEVRFYSGLLAAQYSWWCEPPSGWKALNDWLQQTQNSLDLLDDCASSRR
jgi:hypothetical protein